MACEALRNVCGLGSWEGRVAHCSVNSAQCNRRDAVASVALSSRFFGVKLASTSTGFHPLNESKPALEPMKVECRTAEPDNDISSSDEYWSRIAGQYEQPMFDALREQVTTGPERATTTTSQRAKSRATVMLPVQEQNQIDWRSFRAKLCSSEAVDQDSALGSTESKLLANSKQWAHRLSVPEVGCVLIATDNLNHHGIFRGAVILVLGLSQDHSYGIILNKKMSFPSSTWQGPDQRVLLALSGCSKYIGGPLFSTPKINVLSGRTDIRGFRSVMPGLAVGGDAALPTLVSAVGSGRIPKNEVNVFVGAVEWESQHLTAETEVFEWWDIAACSSETILQSSPDQLRQNLRSLLSL